MRKQMIQYGFEIEFQNIKLKFGEVDLVCRRNHLIILLEVKCLNNEWRSFERISQKQLNRLHLNRNLIFNFFPQYEVRSFVVWVDKNCRIQFIEI